MKQAAVFGIQGVPIHGHQSNVGPFGEIDGFVKDQATVADARGENAHDATLAQSVNADNGSSPRRVEGPRDRAP